VKCVKNFQRPKRRHQALYSVVIFIPKLSWVVVSFLICLFGMEAIAKLHSELNAAEDRCQASDEKLKVLEERKRSRLVENESIVRGTEINRLSLERKKVELVDRLALLRMKELEVKLLEQKYSMTLFGFKQITPSIQKSLADFQHKMGDHSDRIEAMLTEKSIELAVSSEEQLQKRLLPALEEARQRLDATLARKRDAAKQRFLYLTERHKGAQNERNRLEKLLSAHRGQQHPVLVPGTAPSASVEGPKAGRRSTPVASETRSSAPPPNKKPWSSHTTTASASATVSAAVSASASASTYTSAFSTTTSSSSSSSSSSSLFPTSSFSSSSSAEPWYRELRKRRRSQQQPVPADSRPPFRTALDLLGESGDEGESEGVDVYSLDKQA